MTVSSPTMFYPSASPQPQGFSLNPKISRMVDKGTQCLLGPPVQLSSTVCITDNGCILPGLGRSPPGPDHTWPLVDHRAQSSHQCTRAPGGGESPQVLRPPCQEQGRPTDHGQHYSKILRQQTGRDSFTDSPLHRVPNLGMVHSEACLPGGNSPTRGGQCVGRLPEQNNSEQPQVAPLSQGIQIHYSPVGDSHDRSLRLTSEYTVSSVLRTYAPSRIPRMLRRRFPLLMGTRSPVCIPTTSTPSQSCGQDRFGQLQLYSDRSLVVTPTMVRDTPGGITGRLHSSEKQSKPPHGPRRPGQTPGRNILPVNGMEDKTTAHLSDAVRAIVLAAQKTSTKRSYTYKWSRFKHFISPSGNNPFTVPVPTVLDFFVHLSSKQMSLSSIKCYAAALSWFRRKAGQPSLFQDPLLHLFLKGYKNTYPPSSLPPPSWSLELVLSQLSKPPFEPMSSINLAHLSWKTAFLVAITSARRASEITALRVDAPYIRFSDDKVTLRTDISFLPKVVSRFHMCQDIVLPALFPNPSTPLEMSLHCLDVKRALLFYIKRTAAHRKSPRLFLKYRNDTLGLPVSSQRLAVWITSTIRLAYQLAGKDPPSHVAAHSTRSLSTSQAFLRGVSLEDICKAATWSSPSTFVSHYKLDIQAKRDAAFGRAVLFSCVA
nr:PREDICTED: uncharacterized protein LOC107982908 [Anolis carolinensis]|eukprot:XP_016849493.1 PREDICTED: uncharacterized protein LOC107982908 [Anolis carolinensis]